MKRFFCILAAATLVTATINFGETQTVEASDCVDVKVIWADGSSSTIDGTDENYLDFKTVVTAELSATTATFDFYELGTSAHSGYQYPAAAIGLHSLHSLWTTVMAMFSAGDSYEYGQSVYQGAMEMRAYVKEVATKCPKTKFVLGGLSQGGQVVSEAIKGIDPDKVIYAATFGDPKLYLPEGANGSKSVACTNGEFSDYRVYAPDCTTYEGILKARIPYQPSGYSGKLGIWCNYHDAICSSYVNWLDLWDDSLAPHGSYGFQYNSDNLYGDAAKIIRDKVIEHLKTESRATGTRNVVVLIDSTGSMWSLYNKYSTYAIKIAKSIIAQGGKVALFTYRDFNDGGAEGDNFMLLCGFTGNAADACTVESFSSKLSNITVSGGGDEPESVLGAAYMAMLALKWDEGASKSLVVLTDDGYHAEDTIKSSTGETLKIKIGDVVALSKSIDPVAIHTITPARIMGNYTELTSLTGGKTFDFNSDEQLEFSTNYVIDDTEATVRRGVLSEPEEYETASIENVNVNLDEGEGSAQISFDTDAYRVEVAINGVTLGVTDSDEITINDLDLSVENSITLTPYPAKGYAGEAAEYTIPASEKPITPVEDEDEDQKQSEETVDGEVTEKDAEIIIPRAPDSGIVKLRIPIGKSML